MIGPSARPRSLVLCLSCSTVLLDPRHYRICLSVDNIIASGEQKPKEKSERGEEEEKYMHRWRRIHDRSAHVPIVINVRFTTNNVLYPSSLLAALFSGTYACKTPNADTSPSIAFSHFILVCLGFSFSFPFSSLSVLSASLLFFSARPSLHAHGFSPNKNEHYEHVRRTERLPMCARFRFYSSSIASKIVLAFACPFLFSRAQFRDRPGAGQEADADRASPTWMSRESEGARGRGVLRTAAPSPRGSFDSTKRVLMHCFHEHEKHFRTEI